MDRCLVVTLCAASCAVGAAAHTNSAEVTYQVLTPAGQAGASLSGISPDLTIFGAVKPSISWHAAVWTSWSPADVVDIHPVGTTTSTVSRRFGSQLVGNTNFETSSRAGLWAGPSAASFKSLHPSAYANSTVRGTDGTHQVGYGDTNAGSTRALMWSGTAASAVSLNPPSAVQSHASDIAGGRAVGWSSFAPLFTEPVAGYWDGTAASWTVLPVPAEYTGPMAFCISPDKGEIGGQAVGSTGVNWAVTWHGSSNTFTSLNPAGYTGSGLSSTDGVYQCGYTIQFGVGQRAALWHGTAESFIDLSAALEPGKYGYSFASELRRDGNDLWIAGSAIQNGTNFNDAILWHITIPTPATTTIFLGFMRRPRRSRGQAR